MAALWQKMQFWKKTMSKYKEGKDFRFIDFNDTDITGIGILTGEYEGVVYHYTGARVDKNSEIPRLEFGYTIVYSGTHDIDVLTKDDNFHIMMGDILTEIIISQQQNEQTRTDNPEEPDLQ